MKSDKKSRPAGRGPAGSREAQLLEPIMHVWLAGLGAVAMAKTEGGKMLNELIKEGVRIQAYEGDLAKKAVRGKLDDVQALVQRLIKELPPFRMLEELRELRKQVDAMNAKLEKLAPQRRAPAARRVAKKSSPRS
jgi:hypothetical protein